MVPAHLFIGAEEIKYGVCIHIDGFHGRGGRTIHGFLFHDPLVYLVASASFSAKQGRADIQLHSHSKWKTNTF